MIYNNLINIVYTSIQYILDAEILDIKLCICITLHPLYDELKTIFRVIQYILYTQHTYVYSTILDIKLCTCITLNLIYDEFSKLKTIFRVCNIYCI